VASSNCLSSPKMPFVSKSSATVTTRQPVKLTLPGTFRNCSPLSRRVMSLVDTTANAEDSRIAWTVPAAYSGRTSCQPSIAHRWFAILAAFPSVRPIGTNYPFMAWCKVGGVVRGPASERAGSRRCRSRGERLQVSIEGAGSFVLLRGCRRIMTSSAFLSSSRREPMPRWLAACSGPGARARRSRRRQAVWR
jgi:hypothetical protein